MYAVTFAILLSVLLLTLLTVEINSTQVHHYGEDAEEEYWPTKSELVQGHNYAFLRSGLTVQNTGPRTIKETQHVVALPLRQDDPDERSDAVVNPADERREDDEGEISPEQWRSRLRTKNARLFHIQHQIMTELQLKRRPNVTSLSDAERTRIEQKMKDEFKDHNNTGVIVGNHGNHRGGVTSSRIQTTLLADCGLGGELPSNGTYVVHFDVLKNRPREAKLQSAFLYLHRKQTNFNDKSVGDKDVRNDRIQRTIRKEKLRKRRREKITIRVYLLKNNKHQQNQDSRRLIKEKITKRFKNDPVRINIKKAAKVWQKPRENFGLEIEIESSSGKVLNPDDIFYNMNCFTYIRTGLKKADTDSTLPRVKVTWVKRSSTNNVKNGGSVKRVLVNHRRLKKGNYFRENKH